MITFLLRLFYGVHGGIKPPLRGAFLYPLRYWWWKRVNALYMRSGIPEEWWDWFRKEVL
jgi:hypothetical protein